MNMEFTVYGEPGSKGRPRFTKRGFVYTPARTKEAENSFLAQAINHRPKKPLTGNLRVCIKTYHSIPKALSKEKAEWAKVGILRPAKRPDIDNILKLVLDAMNERFFQDDRQVIELHMTKWYSETPRTEVEIEEYFAPVF